VLYNPPQLGLNGEDKRRKLRIRGIALPNEHGSWGILLEPIVASLAVAPTAAGAFAALFVLGAFLLRQPSRIFISDLKSGRRLPQTIAAGAFASGFACLAAAGASGALLLTDPREMLPLAVLVPFGVFQLYNDVSRKTRDLIPELAGSAAISASAPAIALAGGWQLPEALALWAVFVSRSVPSIVYVRQRLRLEKGKAFTKTSPALLHIGAASFVALLAYLGLASWFTLPVFMFLGWRCLEGLSDNRKKMKAVQLGIRETVYGAVLAASVIAGFYTGI